jgi:hypothetical protein
MTASQGALFSALYNISSGIGRIGFGYMADMLVGVCTTRCLLSAYLADISRAKELDFVDHRLAVDPAEQSDSVAVQCHVCECRRVNGEIEA